MLNSNEFFWFSVAALLHTFTPGPNMACCLSRSSCQGRMAGLFCLAGVLAAYGVHVLTISTSLSLLVLVSPMAYELLKMAGSVYLLWLAWLVWRAGRAKAQMTYELVPARAWTLFCKGFFINLFNIKAMLFYLVQLPQFLKIDHGGLLAQSIHLGTVQMVIGGVVIGMLVCGVARLEPLLASQGSIWRGASRYAMSSVLVVLAARLLMLRIGL